MPRGDLIRFRRGDAAAWTAANPTLESGEPGYERDTGRLKVGNGLLAWNDLPYTAAQGPAGTSGLQSRQDAVITTPSLAPAASAAGNLTLAAGYRLLRIVTTRPARVRLYTDSAARVADGDRKVGIKATAGSGLVFEFISDAALLSSDLTPLVDGAVLSDTPGDTAVPYAITNLDTVAGPVSVTLTYIRTE